MLQGLGIVDPMRPQSFIVALWLASIIAFTYTESISSKKFPNPFSSQKQMSVCMSQHHWFPLSGKLGCHVNRMLLQLRGGCNEADNEDFRDEKGHGFGSDSEENWDESGHNHTGADNASHVKSSTAREGLIDFHYRKGEVFYNKVPLSFPNEKNMSL